jgi:hypothetical protein
MSSQVFGLGSWKRQVRLGDFSEEQPPGNFEGTLAKGSRKYLFMTENKSF